MASWTPVVLGALMILVGALSVINHPTIDYFNRLMKSMGTTQRPRDIEMSETSIHVGQYLGAILVLVGIWLVVTEIIWLLEPTGRSADYGDGYPRAIESVHG